MSVLIAVILMSVVAGLQFWRAERWRKAFEQSGERETVLIQALTAMLFDGGPDARRKAWAALRQTTAVLTEEPRHD